jgi:GAF domain-containing protein
LPPRKRGKAGKAPKKGKTTSRKRKAPSKGRGRSGKKSPEKIEEPPEKGLEGPQEETPLMQEDLQVRATKALQRVLKAIGTDFDFDVVAEHVVSELREVLDLERAVLGLLDKSGVKMMVYAIHVEHASELDAGRPVERRENGMWVAVNTREPHVCHDMAETEKDIEESSILLREGIRSYISFPLIVDDKVEGVINFGSSKVGAFDDPAVVEVLRPSVYLIARALKGSRLHDQLNDSITKMQVVDKASDMARNIEDDDEFLQKVLKEAQEAFGQFNFVYFIIDEEEKVFRIRDFKAGFQYNALGGYTQSLEEGMLAKVYRTMSAWVVNDSSKADYFVEAPSTTIGAEIAAPSVVNVKVKGILSCITPIPFNFRSYEVWVVKQLADIIGKRLYQP